MRTYLEHVIRNTEKERHVRIVRECRGAWHSLVSPLLATHSITLAPVWLLGDIVEGESIFKGRWVGCCCVWCEPFCRAGQVYETHLSLMEQIDQATTILVESIPCYVNRYESRQTPFSVVRLPPLAGTVHSRAAPALHACPHLWRRWYVGRWYLEALTAYIASLSLAPPIPGNHGRLKRGEYDPRTNADKMVYKMTASLLDAETKSQRISWAIPQPQDQGYVGVSAVACSVSACGVTRVFIPAGST